MVERALEQNGLEITDEGHELAHGGKRYFGLIEIQHREFRGGFSSIVGVRNDYDQPLSAEVVAGSRELVSNNLSFSGIVPLEQEMALNSHEELSGRMSRMSGVINRLNKYWLRHEQRMDHYRKSGMNDIAAHDLIIRAIDAGACPNRLIPAVLGHWRVPEHEEFGPRTAWSLFNAFTEALQDSLFELPPRTERLHRLFDARVGIKTYPKGQDGG